MVKRRKTRTVNIGKVAVGSGSPVSIQSMAKTDTRDVDATVKQINRLGEAGCEIVRVAVKDMDAAKAISSIKSEIKLPLVADIHYDHTLALEAVKRGADKIRINPGNITKPEDVEKVIDVCASKGIPIRIGANSGSLPEKFSGSVTPSEIMARGVLKYLEMFRKKNFNDIIISLKASDVPETVGAYRALAGECDYPFHVGVTAAGSKETGTVKSAVGIGALLLDGIGDTIRVSLTGDPVEEVVAARKILSSSGARSFGPEVISCPTCGRCQVDLLSIAGEVEKAVEELCCTSSIKPRKFTVAVMGCEVNGPGESEAADIGVAFGKGSGAIFRRGKIVRTVKVSEAVGVLMEMIREELGEG
ncbi:MAG TPA: flavodoxin-dependent (E)-4-hydroxy-3-methylbut-2-enyl-diphosphate synthase [Candidatus Omnitrophota bacterium]|nr:flavodoxin-dependent (E)-4-hydroxy-3-methylbut-2-enyl-diphosphate synthase [Candidatus Omnitrophota bacterium]